MDKPLSILAIIIVFLIVTITIAALVYKSMPVDYDKTRQLNAACLELIKNGCDESVVSIGSKTFEDICGENGLSIDECKSFCGCKK